MFRQKVLCTSVLILTTILIAVVILLLTSYFGTAEKTNNDAQDCWIKFNEKSEKSREPEVSVTESDTNHIVIEFDVHGMYVKNINEDFQTIIIPENGWNFEIGKPQMPAIREFLIIPSNEIKAELLDSEQFTLSDYNIYPTQEPTTDFSKTLNFSINQEFYSKDNFYPENIVEIVSFGTIRDYRIIQLQFNPIQFNPKTKELKIYNHAKIELKFGELIIDEKQQTDNAFEKIYQETLLNYEHAKDWKYKRGTFSQDAGDLHNTNNRANYLIITFDSFYDSILPLADSKIKRGLEPMVVNVSDIYAEFPAGSNDESIHDFITYTFENWELPPVYILLVGDVNEIPTHYNGNSASDHYYSCVGNEDIYYPDLHVGRLSASNTNDVELIRDKIINYCENPPEGEWQTNIMLAAHEQGAPGKYQGCKEEIRNDIILESPNADIWKITTRYGAEGATVQEVIDDINNGMVIVNYRGHGGATDWASNEIHLTRTDVMVLENDDLLPIVFSIACNNNEIDYDSGDCIGEAWLKSPNGGAISHFGATRPSYTTQNHYHDKLLFNDTFNMQMEICGEVLTLADIQMLDYYGTGSAGSDNVLIYLQLGDPETPLCAPILFEHDLTVKNLEAPRHLLPDEEGTISAQVKNTGLNDESNLVVKLLVDGEEIKSKTIDTLKSREFVKVSFTWKTDIENNYNLSIHAFLPPEVEEEFKDNNQKNDFINVFVPRGEILVDYGHVNNIEHTNYYNEIFLNRYLDCYTTEEINPELLEDYEVIVIAGATNSYSTSEISIITDFVNDGGGLLVIGDEDSAVCNDLTNFADIYWTDVLGVNGTTNFINSHSITSGVNELYFDSPSLSLAVDSTEKIIVWDITHTTIQVVATEYGQGRIVVLVDDNCLDNQFIVESDNIILGTNIIDWINNEKPIAIIDSPVQDNIFSPVEQIDFSAVSSSDPDGDNLAYSWTSNIDGQLSIAEQFSRSLSKGEHIITLMVDDNHGKNDVTQTNIFVNTPPVAIIDTPLLNEFILSGTNIEFDASSSYDDDGDGLKYKWISSLDGEIGNSQIFNKKLSHGKHKITLIVEDWLAKSQTEINIIINIAPIVTIANPIENNYYLPTDEITFDGSSSYDEDDDLLTFNWTSNRDGDIGNNKIVSKKLSHGKHEITLEVNDGYETVKSHISITINTPPIAKIDFPKNEIYLTNETIEFDSESSNDPDYGHLIYMWKSDLEGNIGNTKKFEKKLSAGQHIITLEVNDGFEKAQTQVTVTVNTPPNAVINNPKDKALYLTTDLIDFDASSSNDFDNDDLTYKWTSNIDGEIQNSVSFQKMLSAGEHKIILEVNDGRKGIDKNEVEITINTPPIAVIDSPENEKTYLTDIEILFDASSSNDLEDELNYLWTSSIEGILGTEKIFSKKLLAGYHTITLLINDSRKGEDETKINIWVNTPPLAVIDGPISNSLFLTTEKIAFDATSSYDIEDDDDLNYIWTSNIDGEIGNEVKITKKLSSGKHKITLHVDDRRGGADTKEIEIEINSPPIAIIDSPSNNEKFLNSKQIIFDATSSYDKEKDDLTYTWTSNNQGELYSGTFKVFKKNLKGGEHLITLKVDDKRGGLDLTSITLFINTLPKAVIDIPTNNSKFSLGEAENIRASSSSDPDGDVLSFKWSSNIDGIIGNEEEISVLLSEGTHIITLEVFDNNDGKDLTTVVIKVVNEEEIDSDTPIIKSNNEDDEFSKHLLLLPIAIILIGIVGLFAYRKIAYEYEEWDEEVEFFEEE